MTRPGFEPMISRSEVHHANHYTIEASYNEGQIFHVESYNVLQFCEVKIKMHVTYNEWILVERWNFLFFQQNILTKIKVLARGFYCTKSKTFVKKIGENIGDDFFGIFFSCFKSVFLAK